MRVSTKVLPGDMVTPEHSNLSLWSDINGVSDEVGSLSRGGLGLVMATRMHSPDDLDLFILSDNGGMGWCFAEHLTVLAR